MVEALQNLISWLPLIAVYYVALIPGKIYKANKDFIVDSNISIKLPPELKKSLTHEEMHILVKKNLNRYLLSFSKVIEEKMTQENLNLYNNNKENLRVNESTTKMLIHCLIKMSLSGGFYSIINNSVNLYSFDVYEHESTKTGPYHELFHMASSYCDKEKNIIYTGFCQVHLKNQFCGSIIGKALNEGYTQTLAERYFNLNNAKQKLSFSYELSRNISNLLEKTIDKEKMENLYMNANLKGLIDELLKFNNNEESLGFVQNIDYVFKYYSESKYIPRVKKLCLNKIKEIQVFLIDAYVKRKVFEIKNNQISKEIFLNDVSSFINDMQEMFIIKKQNLNQFTKKEILEFIKQKIPQEIVFESKSI